MKIVLKLSQIIRLLFAILVRIYILFVQVSSVENVICQKFKRIDNVTLNQINYPVALKLSFKSKPLIGWEHATIHSTEDIYKTVRLAVYWQEQS